MYNKVEKWLRSEKNSNPIVTLDRETYLEIKEMFFTFRKKKVSHRYCFNDGNRVKICPNCGQELEEVNE